ncbi:MAG: hypothetical protein ACOY5R_06495 [Pseudomonadota bacterium]
MKKLPNARPSRPCRMPALLIASALALALSSCARERPTIGSPPAADLRSEPEPQLNAAAIEADSAAALDAYDSAHAAWGRRGWDQVARIRQWFCDAGVTMACQP